MFRKEKKWGRGWPQDRVGVGVKRKREPSRRRLGRRLAPWGSTEKKQVSHIFSDWEGDTSTQTSDPIETELLVWPPPQWGPMERRTKWPNRQRKESSWRKKAEKQEDHSWRERKVQGQERILAEHLDRLKRSDCCDFEKPQKRAYQKRKIKFNEQSKEGSQPKWVCGKEWDARQSRKLSRNQ